MVSLAGPLLASDTAPCVGEVALDATRQENVGRSACRRVDARAKCPLVMPNMGGRHAGSYEVRRPRRTGHKKTHKVGAC